MSSLKQLITDAEKFKRIRIVIDQHLQSKAFENYMELGSMLDYHSNTLYEIMSGKRNPPDILIYKFCDLFKLSPGYFFGREEKSTSSGKQRTVKKEELLTLQRMNADLTEELNKLINK